jgi:hypothetical protein
MHSLATSIPQQVWRQAPKHYNRLATDLRPFKVADPDPGHGLDPPDNGGIYLTRRAHGQDTSQADTRGKAHDMISPSQCIQAPIEMLAGNWVGYVSK